MNKGNDAEHFIAAEFVSDNGRSSYVRYEIIKVFIVSVEIVKARGGVSASTCEATVVKANKMKENSSKVLFLQLSINYCAHRISVL